MPSTSQLGAAASSVPAAVVTAFDRMLSNTNTSTVQLQSAGSGSTILVASAGNNDLNVAVTAPTSFISGSITNGAGTELLFQLPAGVGFLSKLTKTADAGSADTYIVSALAPFWGGSSAPAVVAQKSSLEDAVDTALSNLLGGGPYVIRLFDFYQGASVAAVTAMALLDAEPGGTGADSLVVGGSEPQLLLDAGSSTGKQLFVVNLASLQDKTLVLRNVEAATLASNGKVRADGSTPIVITSDNKAQIIEGGTGNDTLIGTGSDTLTGGAGNDVFGFDGNGKYTVTDFNKTGDLLAFNLPGVGSIDQLKAQVTGVVKTGASITYQLGADTSITLIGVAASDLTAAMITFTL